MAIIKKSTNNKCWRGCGEKETFLQCWWEYKLIQPLWRTVWRFLKKLKIELPYDPAIPLLGIYPEETIIQKDTCRASPVLQWLRVRLSMQGTWVRALVREDPSCRGAAGPVSHGPWACASGACAPQWERTQQWQAHIPQKNKTKKHGKIQVASFSHGHPWNILN